MHSVIYAIKILMSIISVAEKLLSNILADTKGACPYYNHNYRHGMSKYLTMGIYFQ